MPPFCATETLTRRELMERKRDPKVNNMSFCSCRVPSLTQNRLSNSTVNVT